MHRCARKLFAFGKLHPARKVVKETDLWGGKKYECKRSDPNTAEAANDEELIRIVDQVIDYIKSTGLNYYVGPFETAIEGDYDELMDIVKECQHIAVRAGAPSVAAYIKVSYKPEGDVLTIDKKVTKHHQ